MHTICRFRGNLQRATDRHGAFSVDIVEVQIDAGERAIHLHMNELRVGARMQAP